MAEGMKEKAEKAGHKIAELATKVGHKIAEGAEKAADWAKEKMHATGNRVKQAAQKTKHPAEECCGTMKSCTDIRERMDVIASCGKLVGTVDRVEGDSIKLTKKDSPDGQHRLIPKSWIARVDEHVHLNKNSDEVAGAFRADDVGCCAG
jgi:hypothetical protein